MSPSSHVVVLFVQLFVVEYTDYPPSTDHTSWCDVLASLHHSCTIHLTANKSALNLMFYFLFPPKMCVEFNPRFPSSSTHPQSTTNEQPTTSAARRTPKEEDTLHNIRIMISRVEWFQRVVGLKWVFVFVWAGWCQLPNNRKRNSIGGGGGGGEPARSH